MPAMALAYGLTLCLLGLGFYLGAPHKSVTALIPTFLGVPVVVAGLLAQRPNLRKHALHACAVFSLLGVLGGGMAIPKVFQMLGGATLARPAAVVEQLILFVLSAGFLALCVRSFVLARRTTAA